MSRGFCVISDEQEALKRVFAMAQKPFPSDPSSIPDVPGLQAMLAGAGKSGTRQGQGEVTLLAIGGAKPSIGLRLY